MSKTGLTIRQDLFAQYLATGMSQVEAYKHAGYTPHFQNAQRLAATPAVSARVAEIMKEKRDRLDAAVVAKVLSLSEYQQEILNLYEKLIAAVPVVVDGVETGTYRMNAAGATKALEMYGRTIGAFNEDKSNKAEGTSFIVGSPEAIRNQVNNHVRQSRTEGSGDGPKSDTPVDGLGERSDGVGVQELGTPSGNREAQGGRPSWLDE